MTRHWKSEYEHWKRVTESTIPYSKWCERRDKNNAIRDKLKSLDARFTYGGWGTPCWKINGWWWVVDFLPDVPEARKSRPDSDRWINISVEEALATIGMITT